MTYFYSVSLNPKGRNPTHNCTACWLTLLETLWHIQLIDTKTHSIRTETHAHSGTHPITFRKLTACSWAKLDVALLVHLCSFPLPSPHLFDSQGQGDPLYNRTSFITTGTITGDVSLSENFKPFFPHLSLFILLSLPSSVVLSCSPPPSFSSSLSLLCLFAWLQWATLQVRLPLAQAHHCRLQCRGGRAPYYILSEGPGQTFFSVFLTMGSSFSQERAWKKASDIISPALWYNEAFQWGAVWRKGTAGCPISVWSYMQAQS